jgi:hypothetical protein
MIRGLLRAQSFEDRTLQFLRVVFILIALVGFVFYGLEHWVLEHYLESWQSRVPFYLSLVGFPLTLAMLFSSRPLVRYPFLAWMLLTFLSGMVGAIFHLVWNAGDVDGTILSIKGFIEAFEGDRPVLAALAHTHIGAVGLIVGLIGRSEEES